MTIGSLTTLGAEQHTAQFHSTTLDALRGHVAVLDEKGIILHTNAAWDRFAAENGGTAVGPGADYLAVCDAAAQDATAREVAGGLREILMGAREELQVEYRCDAPGLPRWFLLRASRQRTVGPPRVVVEHVDVTAMHGRAEAERELRSARDHLRAVTESMGEGLFTLDVGDRLTYMNAAAERLLGWTRDELIGRQMHDVVHYRRCDGTPFPASECPLVTARQRQEVVRREDEIFIRRDGTELPVAYTSAPFQTADGVAGAVVLFSDDTQRRARDAQVERDLEALRWIGRIKDALERDRFVLFAQPIIDLASGAVVQHELLIRMLDEDGGLVAPGLFLPTAEAYGLIRDIDRWVIREGMKLNAAGHAVEINLSAESLGDPDLFGFVVRELEARGGDPARLVFELTETALLRDDAAAQAFIEQVERLGCSVALDDFGTGYGGFHYLKRLPVDYLKIDIEFVRDLSHNPASQHVVKAVVSLADGFGYRTVAEGVEDVETLGLLRDYGVDFAQGYGIGRPGPAAEVLAAQLAA